MQKDVKAFAHEIFEIARENLTRDGHLVPVAFMFSDGDESPSLFNLAPFMDTHHKKDVLSHALRKTCEKVDAYGIVMVVEAWAGMPVEGTTAEDLKKEVEEGRYIPPSQLPERRELITLTWEWRKEDGTLEEGLMSQFFHHEGEKIVLGEKDTHSGSHGMGRFSGFLRRPDEQE